MYAFYSITTNQAAIIGLFRVVNRYVGNLQLLSGVFPDYAAPLPKWVNRHRNAVSALRPFLP
jgi:hypothetical protein